MANLAAGLKGQALCSICVLAITALHVICRCVTWAAALFDEIGLSRRPSYI